LKNKNLIKVVGSREILLVGGIIINVNGPHETFRHFHVALLNQLRHIVNARFEFRMLQWICNGGIFNTLNILCATTIKILPYLRFKLKNTLLAFWKVAVM
jgi:hypothetical protein